MPALTAPLILWALGSWVAISIPVGLFVARCMGVRPNEDAVSEPATPVERRAG